MTPADTTIHVLLPVLGESVTEGTIIEWKKAVGDPVAQDEIIVEVSTDTVDLEVPSPASGTLAEIAGAAIVSLKSEFRISRRTAPEADNSRMIGDFSVGLKRSQTWEASLFC